MSNRREFIVQFSLGTSALLASQAFAQGAMVADADPQAAALGYKADGTKTDKAKFPKYAAGQQCSSCALFQGKAGDKAGPCPLFAGKQVSPVTLASENVRLVATPDAVRVATAQAVPLNGYVPRLIGARVTTILPLVAAVILPEFALRV